MNYTIGIDIGTTAVKAAAFSDTGVLLALRSYPCKMFHPREGWSEQNPEEIFTAVVEGINSLYDELQPAEPALVSFSALMHSLLLMDENGRPLTNSILWADNRAAAIATALKNTEHGQQIYHTTGVPVHAMSPLCKLLWLKENDPSLIKKTAHIIGIKEYVFYKLFNQYVTDTSVASATGLLNIKKLQWDEDILKWLDIPAGKLPEVVSVKHILKLPANTAFPGNTLRIPPQTPFVAGSSDGASANISTGDTSMVVTIGTSAAARILSGKPGTDEEMRTFCYHAIDNYYIIGGASNNGAVVLDWLKDTLLQSGEDIAQMLHSAGTIPAGSNGLLLLPYILGERAPLWDAHAKAVFFGLSVNHTRAHLVRAAMEGVIYNIYSVCKTIMEKNTVHAVYATGGFTKNELWLQMLADTLNRKIILTAAEESSALGAAITGMQALGIPYTISNTHLAVYEPNEKNHGIYMENYNRFERLYKLVRGEFLM